MNDLSSSRPIFSIALNKAIEALQASAKSEMGAFYADYVDLILDLHTKGWRRKASQDIWMSSYLADKPEYSILNTNSVSVHSVECDNANSLKKDEDYFFSRWALWKCMRGKDVKDNLEFQVLDMKNQAKSDRMLKPRFSTTSLRDRRLTSLNQDTTSDVITPETLATSLASECEKAVWKILLEDLRLECDSQSIIASHRKRETVVADSTITMSQVSISASLKSRDGSRNIEASPNKRMQRLLQARAELPREVQYDHTSSDPAYTGLDDLESEAYQTAHKLLSKSRVVGCNAIEDRASSDVGPASRFGSGGSSELDGNDSYISDEAVDEFSKDIFLDNSGLAGGNKPSRNKKVQPLETNLVEMEMRDLSLYIPKDSERGSDYNPLHDTGSP